MAVPSREVRRFLEAERERRATHPLHPREREDAPPQVLRDLWRDLARLARRLGITAPGPGDGPEPYDPDVYGRVYQTVLRHRHVELVALDTILPTGTLSVYDFAAAPRDLVPAEAEAARFIQETERRYADPAALDRAIARWWEV